MKFVKSLLFCVLLGGLNSIANQCMAQCQPRVKYEIKSKVQGASVISMKSLDGANSMRIQLYDLNEGKVIDEVEKQIASDFVVVFDNVKPSYYAFYIWLPGCKKPTVISGEKGGVLVEN